VIVWLTSQVEWDGAWVDGLRASNGEKEGEHGVRTHVDDYY
jgi:hypothetical protein